MARRPKAAHTVRARCLRSPRPALRRCSTALVSPGTGPIPRRAWFSTRRATFTVFEITSVGKKGSTEKVLYSFGSQPGDGSNPLATLIFDKEGNLYGTTLEGGVYNYGTVFEVIP